MIATKFGIEVCARARLETIARHAGRDGATRRRWLEAVRVDCASPEALAPPLLRFGLGAIP